MDKESFCAGCEFIRRIVVWLEPTEYICPAEFDPEDSSCPRHDEYEMALEEEKNDGNDEQEPCSDDAGDVEEADYPQG